MKIVIDIDENLYARLFDNGKTDAVDMLKACVAIRKGVPLPKGHGRLIDADELFLDIQTDEQMRLGEHLAWVKERIDNAQPIIEADKEVQDADCNLHTGRNL
jgi:hypothetical protein